MTCKDCIHYDVCLLGACIDGKTGTCLNFKDKSRYIELPCKMGDTVYCLINEDNELDECSKHICMSEVLDYSFEKQTLLIHLDFWNTDINPRTDIEFVNNVFGKSVFLTREEAEKALKEGDMK